MANYSGIAREKISCFCIEDKLLSLAEGYEFCGFILKTENLIQKNGEKVCAEIRYDLILDFGRTEESFKKLEKAVEREIILMPTLDPSKKVSLTKKIRGNKWDLIKEMLPLVRLSRDFNESFRSSRKEPEQINLFS